MRFLPLFLLVIMILPFTRNGGRLYAGFWINLQTLLLLSAFSYHQITGRPQSFLVELFASVAIAGTGALLTNTL